MGRMGHIGQIAERKLFRSFFFAEQLLLSLDAPAVAGEVAVGADDAVARDGDGERVGGAGPGDGADGARVADAAGDFGVAGGLAEGDLGERVPDALLEGGAADVEREVQADSRIFDEADDFCDGQLEVAVGADQVRAGKAVLEVAGELVGIVAEEDGADAFVGRGDEDGAERALADGEPDGGAGSALAKSARFHAEGLRGAGVEAAVGIIAGVVDGAGDGFAAGQRGADFFGAMGGGVGLGAEAGEFGEEALKVEGAEADGAREFVECGRFFGGLDEAAGLGDDFGVVRGKGGHAGGFY